MRIQVITAFHELFAAYLREGVVGTAIRENKVQLQLINPRDFTEDRHKTIDDRPFGGGDGMVMLAEPLEKAFASLPDLGRVIYLSPQGRSWTHGLAQEYAALPTVTLLCGRYAGVDERFLRAHVQDEISIGDYVLSGGELGALVMIDSMARLIPGVLGNETSAQSDSFADGLLEAPLYTRPRVYGGSSVPDILLGGHHENIKRWRKNVSLLRTRLRRPDLLASAGVSSRDWEQALKLYDSMTAADREVLGLPHTWPEGSL